jgi:hypothetical protein
MKLENWIKGMKSRKFMERLIAGKVDLDKNSSKS